VPRALTPKPIKLNDNTAKPMPIAGSVAIQIVATAASHPQRPAPSCRPSSEACCGGLCSPQQPFGGAPFAPRSAMPPKRQASKSWKCQLHHHDAIECGSEITTTTAPEQA
jgi:hypothetical protein